MTELLNKLMSFLLANLNNFCTQAMGWFGHHNGCTFSLLKIDFWVRLTINITITISISINTITSIEASK